MLIAEKLIKNWTRIHYTKDGVICDCGCGKRFAYEKYKRKVYRLTLQKGTRRYSVLEVRRECDT